MIRVMHGRPVRDDRPVVAAVEEVALVAEYVGEQFVDEVCCCAGAEWLRNVVGERESG